ncbi:hypothetical protein KC337_g61 [Hortaea werneckii]|nr:hypothetical protein KC337_g61 [Hortaea werneckii]
MTETTWQTGSSIDYLDQVGTSVCRCMVLAKLRSRHPDQDQTVTTVQVMPQKCTMYVCRRYIVHSTYYGGSRR